MDVFITNEQDEVDVDLDRLRRVAEVVLDSEDVDPSVEVSLMCVDEATMRSLSKQFLGIDDATDVLAFPIDGEVDEETLDTAPGGRVLSPDEAPQLLGDVVICPSVAKRQAEEYKVPYEEELDMLVVHGLLHLLGYDHGTEDELAEMESRQETLLRKVASSEATRRESSSGAEVSPSEGASQHSNGALGETSGSARARRGGAGRDVGDLEDEPESEGGGVPPHP